MIREFKDASGLVFAIETFSKDKPYPSIVIPLETARRYNARKLGKIVKRLIPELRELMREQHAVFKAWKSFGQTFGDPDNAGVYGLWVKPTKKWYVGASLNIRDRLEQHRLNLNYALERNVDDHPLGEAAAIFGMDNIYPHVLEVVEDSRDLADRERYWCERLNAVQGGYNREIPRPHHAWE